MLGKKRAMTMSLLGIVLGIAFFVITQAQTSDLRLFLLGQYLVPMVQFVFLIASKICMEQFVVLRRMVRLVSFFHSKEGALYTEGIENPKLLKDALDWLTEISGISEILEGNAILNGISRSQTVQIHGIVPSNHIMVSDLEKQIIRGELSAFELDPMTILIGNRVAQRLMLQVGDREYSDEQETFNCVLQVFLRS